jgi:hypothetical protein
VEGEPVRLVFGYERSYADANELRDRARQAGYARTSVARDGCGRLRIFVDNVPSVAAGEELAGQASAAGLEPTLEAGPATIAPTG